MPSPRIRSALALAALILPLAACDRQEPTAQYDPRIDGIMSEPVVMVDLSILADQKTLHPGPRSAAPAPATIPAATSAPTSAPTTGEAATIPAEGATTIPTVETAPTTIPAEAPPATSVAEPAIDGATGELVLSNGTHLPSPAPGFKWVKRGASPPSFAYAAVQEGTASNLVLIMNTNSFQSADDQAKVAYINGAYDGYIKNLPQLLTDINAVEPKTGSPVPERITFSYSGKLKNGNMMFGNGTIIFSQQTYFLVAAGSSAQEATSLLKISESIK